MSTGLIDQYRDTMEGLQFDDGEGRGRAQAETAGHILWGVSDILGMPEYVGSVDTALAHYLGEAAFDNEAVTDPYVGIVAKVYNQAVSSGEYEHETASTTPVLIVNRLSDAPTSALVHVDSRGVRFRSSRNTRASYSELALVGPTALTMGDIPEDNEITGLQVANTEDLLLSNTFTNHFDGDSSVAVGWQAVEQALAEAVDKASTFRSMGKIGQAVLLKKFLTAGGAVPPAGQAPKLAALIELADKRQSDIGRMASHETGVTPTDSEPAE